MLNLIITYAEDTRFKLKKYRNREENYHLTLSKVVSILGLILSALFTKSQRWDWKGRWKLIKLLISPNSFLCAAEVGHSPASSKLVKTETTTDIKISLSLGHKLCHSSKSWNFTILSLEPFFWLCKSRSLRHR